MAVRTMMSENHSINQREPSAGSPIPVESVILGVDTQRTSTRPR